MWKRKSPISQAAQAMIFQSGLNLRLLYQRTPPNRRVAEPNDPWCCFLANGNGLLATRQFYGEGATAEDAVRAAIPAGSNFREALSRYEAAVDDLLAVL